jgi:hypothetical protein
MIKTDQIQKKLDVQQGKIEHNQLFQEQERYPQEKIITQVNDFQL